jgi:hypothetical protein
MNSRDNEKIDVLLSGMSFREIVEIFYKATKRFRDEEMVQGQGLRVYARPVVAEAGYVIGDDSPE